MAIGRFSVGVGSKGKASPHAQYIAREGKYAKTSKDLEKLEFTGYGNMPKWADHEPNFFWKMSDEYERKNGSTYREHVITLPRELTLDERHDLIKDWITREIGDKHAYQYAIHNPIAMDGQEQPHCHLMFSERLIDDIERDPDQYFKRFNRKNPTKGGAKKANTPQLAAERKQALIAQRDRWEQICNKHLEKAGIDARISMKSLKAQGIEREAINISMIQINKTKFRDAYQKKLKAVIDYKLAGAETKGINITRELKNIKQEVELYERADKAITRSQSILGFTERKIGWSDHRSRTITKYLVSTNKSNNTIEQKVISNQSSVARTEQRVIRSQSSVARTEQRVIRSQSSVARAEREVEWVSSAIIRRLEQQRKAEKIEQERIEKRSINDLLRLELWVHITDPRYGTELKNDMIRIGENFLALYNQVKRERWNITVSNKDIKGKLTNYETIENPTAKAIERFMMNRDSLSNISTLNDFDNLSIRDFTEKYNLPCDFEDLKKLDSLYPVSTLKQHDSMRELSKNNGYDLNM